MAEVVTADLQARFYLSDVKTTAIDAALAKSIAEVKSRIGTAAYTDMTGATPSDAVKAVFVTEAVENFTMARLARNLNLRFRSSGLTIQEQDSASPINNNNIINKYLDPTQQLSLSNQFRDQALENLALAGFNTSVDLYLPVNVSDVTLDTSIPRQTSSEAFDQ